MISKFYHKMSRPLCVTFSQKSTDVTTSFSSELLNYIGTWEPIKTVYMFEWSTLIYSM